MKKEDLVVPFIHLNGTGRQELLKQMNTVWEALEEAIKKMKEAAPHGRDYYFNDRNDGKHGIRKANEQHYSRVNRVIEVQDEYEMLMSILVMGEGDG